MRTISNALSLEEVSENRIIAINLAREGMEAMRYIRDFNWLYYGSQPRICWNHLQDNDNSGDLSGDTECAEDGSNGFAENQMGNDGAGSTSMEYILKQEDYHWFISRAGFNSHLIDNGDWDTLTEDNIGVNAIDNIESTSADDTVRSFRICRDTNDTLYVSCMNDNADNSDYTKFYRYVHIAYNNDPTDTNDDDADSYNNGQEENILTVTVGIKWLENGIMKDVVLTSQLSDFYERDDQDLTN